MTLLSSKGFGIDAFRLAASTTSRRTCPPNSPSRLVIQAARHEWRPDPRDVIRLSKGQKARKRGTGSRNVAHRLNADEATQFEVAQKRRYVVLMGDGHRRERKDSPLCNTWRQWADSHEWACVQVRQGRGGDDKDIVVVDLSTLRDADDHDVRTTSKQKSAELGCLKIKEDDPIGFLDEASLLALDDSDYSVSEEIARLNAAAEEHGTVVRSVKQSVSAQLEDGSSVNQHPDVQEAVQVMKRFRNQAAMLEEELQERAAAVSEAKELAAEEARCEGPIWDIRPVEIHFEAPDRPTARLLASEIVSACCPDMPKIKK